MKKIIFALLVSILCFSCELDEVLPLGTAGSDTTTQDPDVTVSDIKNWNTPLGLDTNIVIVD